MDKVAEHARSGGYEEVVGVLIGKVVGQTIVIEDAVSGRIESTQTRAVLPPETMAKIADDIVKQRLHGNIIGWYHSHPGHGIFMSNVDVETQSRLQQFSSYIAAMVIDPTTDQVGFFTIDSSGRSQSIPPEQVRVFEEGEEAVFSEVPKPAETEPAGLASIPGPTIYPKRKNRRFLVCLFLIGIMLGSMAGIIFGFLVPTRTVIVIVNRSASTTHAESTTTTTATLTRTETWSLIITETMTSQIMSQVTTVVDGESVMTITLGTSTVTVTSTRFSMRTATTTTTMTSTTTSTSTFTVTSNSTTTQGVTFPVRLWLIPGVDSYELGCLAQLILYSMSTATLLIFRTRETQEKAET